MVSAIDYPQPVVATVKPISNGEFLAVLSVTTAAGACPANAWSFILPGWTQGETKFGRECYLARRTVAAKRPLWSRCGRPPMVVL